MIKKLHWLFIKSFIGPFIGTFFIALFLLLMQTIWKYLGDLVGKGLEISVIAEFIFYFAIHLIPMALPLALLLSSIMVFGNLAERYELVAIKSSGVSLIRAMRPMFIITILLSIGAFYTANNFIPKANLSWGALLYDVSQKKPAMNIVDKVFFKDIDGYALRVGKKHDDNQTIEDIIIYVEDKKKHGNNNIIVAKRGKMTVTDDKHFMILALQDGKRYTEMVGDVNYSKTMPHNLMSFDNYNMAIDLTELAFNRTDKERFSEDQRMLNVKELSYRIDSLSKYIKNKKTNVHRYLEPYFHEIQDSSLVVADSNVENRVATIMALAKSKHDSDKGVIPPKSRSFPKALKKKRSDSLKRVPVGELEVSTKDIVPQIGKTFTAADASEKAMQNVSNMKRISSNNTNNTQNEEDLRAKYQVEWYRKYTLAVSIIVLFFIGAPLGAIIKKGGFGLPLVISILLFILYWVMNVFGEKLVKEGALEPFVGMWMSTFILFPLAIFLTYKASTDSKLFDLDAYKRLIPAKIRNKFG